MSIFSREVTAMVAGKFMMQQLSGLPVSKVQIPFWIARWNLAVGEANASFFCIIMSRDSGTFSPDDLIRSFNASVSSGAGFGRQGCPGFVASFGC